VSEQTHKKDEPSITLSKDMVYGGALAILACLLVLSLFTHGFGVVKDVQANQTANQTAVQKLSDAELKSKAENYTNQNLLSNNLTVVITKLEPYGAYTTLASANIMNGTTVLQSLQIYISNDGSSIFFQGFRLNESVKKTVPTSANTTTTKNSTATTPPPKADRPKAQAFIMAFCPFGLQFLKAYAPVMELLGSKADVEVRFVSYAMHGQKELEGNSYIYCVQKEAKDKLAAYLRCSVEAGNYTGCVAKSGIDADKISACVNQTDAQYNITGMYNDQSTWSGGKYPQYNVDKALTVQSGVGGSPTFVLNGQKLSVSRSAEAIKKAVCDSFTKPPPECNTTLSSSVEAAGVGPVGGAASNGAASGGCGG